MAWETLCTEMKNVIIFKVDQNRIWESLIMAFELWRRRCLYCQYFRGLAFSWEVETLFLVGIISYMMVAVIDDTLYCLENAIFNVQDASTLALAFNILTAIR